MKRIALALAVVPIAIGACGKGTKAKDDAPPAPPIDAAPLPDGPALTECATPTRGTHIKFAIVGQVVGAAMLATSPPDDPRLFVLEQRGAIRIFDQGTLRPDPFLDLSGDAGGPVRAGGEMGLLGLAFHPDYATNGTFFVYYTRNEAGDTTNPLRDVLARCKVRPDDPDRADPASCVELFKIPDFATNHNGGMIEFGADGLLYIGTGDGGGGGDPQRNGQALTDGSPNANSHALLGKMLRIDVDHEANGERYAIPADNPFADGVGGAPEIFLIGLRNPWRWSFDRATGDLWIGDVGQGAIEEVTVLRAGQQAGKNLGWSEFEGKACFRTGACTEAGKVFPQDERPHSDGWAAIIGGQVYRGRCFPDLVGTYFYADNRGRKYASAKLNADGTLTVEDLAPAPGGDPFPGGPASLHANAAGELYLTTTAGTVFRLEAVP